MAPNSLKAEIYDSPVDVQAVVEPTDSKSHTSFKGVPPNSVSRVSRVSRLSSPSRVWPSGHRRSYAVDDDVPDVNMADKIKSRKRKSDGWVEITCNVIGTFGFIIGSLGWVVGANTAGCWIFATACFFCGLGCSIYGHKFLKSNDFVTVYGLALQAAGCFVFIIASILFLFPEYATLALIGFLVASMLFVCGCTLTHVVLRCFTGPMAPLVPCRSPPMIPTALFNTLGSWCFTIGSIELFYPALALQGAWWYTIGSVIFFLASWGDFTTWYLLCVAQKQENANDYVVIKYF